MFDRKLFTTLAHRPQPRTTAPRKPPVFPLPTLNGQPPVVLGFDPADPAVDVAYERSQLLGGPRVRSAARDSPLYWIPKHTPVLVVSDGRVVYAQRHSGLGHVILVDHDNGWLTFYGGLEHAFVPPTDRRPSRDTRVAGGDILGYIGDSRPGELHTLQFELWRNDQTKDYEAVDPIRFMNRWRPIAWNDARATAPPVRVA